MIGIEEALKGLPERHVRALRWFVERAGSTRGWPEQLPDGDYVVTRAKGIYKPAWSEYALSVRQTLKAVYPDKDPVYREDGTWRYAYYQEGAGQEDRDALYTNKALMRCMSDRVPVGVMQQTKPKPGVQYEVLGLALVSKWEDGYFYLEGFSPAGVAREPGA